MTTAFVTGASGFIGGHLVAELVRRGMRARCLVRPTSRVDDLPTAGVEFVRGSVESTDVLSEGLRGAAVVFHLAGLVSAFAARDFQRVNVLGTQHVLRACAAQPNPPVLVLVSSIAAAGTARRGRLRLETDLPVPISHYGRSKRAAERVAERYAQRVPTTVVRPGIVFGPRDRSVLPVFKSIARLRVHAIPGYQKVPLSLIHVSDLVDLLIAAASRGQRLAFTDRMPRELVGGYYTGCDAEHPSYLDLGMRIARVLGRPHVYWMRYPEWSLWLAALASEAAARVRGEPDIFNLDKIREATAGCWAFSNELARRDLNWQPQRSLDERLGETADWYRQHDWL
jgi:nucleoside-diphosphate-sugar epimerase